MDHNRFNAVGKMFFLAVVFVATIALLYLSFVWSLSQTIKYSTLMFNGSAFAGILMGLFIQLSPNVFLMVSSRSSGNQKILMIVLFFFFSVADALTNVLERSRRGPFDLTQAAINAHYLGYAIDILIVFGEELSAIFISHLFNLLGEVMVLLGGRVPEWFFAASDVAMTSGSGRSGRSNRSRTRRNNSTGATVNVEDILSDRHNTLFP